MRWLWDLLERREERRAAAAYERRYREAVRSWMASPQYAKMKACKHDSTRPNPDSTARDGWERGEICNDCGSGITRMTRERAAEIRARLREKAKQLPNGI